MRAKIILVICLASTLFCCEKMESLAKRELDKKIQEVAKKRGLTIKDCNVQDTLFHSQNISDYKGYTLIYSTKMQDSNWASIGAIFFSDDGSINLNKVTNQDYWKNNNCD